MKHHHFANPLRTFFVFFLIFQLSGCATVSKVETVGDIQPVLADKCQIEIIDKSALPIGSKIIGNIETHIKGNIFFGGVVRTNDEGYKELRIKSCALGGNAVVIDDVIESSAAEMRHIHIWARVLIIPKT
ncbi:hypothetical protein [Undibacterium sp. TJN19]|uniref:hypothetical protein n=1 Tax=Undibacterium sp. TJN19 TaxID=3413055 RepID=UPI003BF06A99